MGNVSTFTHLTLSERERIGVYAADGKACREIAILVGRHHTTISRELRRNRQPHPQMQGYIGCYAQQEAHRRNKTKASSTKSYGRPLYFCKAVEMLLVEVFCACFFASWLMGIIRC